MVCACYQAATPFQGAPLERIHFLIAGIDLVAEGGPQAQAHAHADGGQGDVAGALVVHAETAEDVEAAVHAGKALEDLVGPGHAVDQGEHLAGVDAGSGALEDWCLFAQAHFDEETVKQAAVARILAAETELAAGEPYELDMLRREDAPGVARLFHAIYGDKYPVIDYYVPERLTALNRQRQVLTVVARLPTGEIAGTGAYYRSSPPNAAVYEQGQLLIDHHYRNTSIAFRILKRLKHFPTPWITPRPFSARPCALT